MLNDFRYAFRMILKNPGFTIVVVLTLGLGIGVNATVFSWLNAILLRPLPGLADPDRLAFLGASSRTERYINLSFPDYRDYRDRNRTLSGLIVFDMQAMSLDSAAAGESQPERIWGSIVSGNYFDVLGVQTVLGRTFLPSEDKVTGAEPVILISHGLWKRRFGGDPSVIGKTVKLSKHPFTIIGVTPKEFRGTVIGLRSDVWVPMMMQEQLVSGGNRLESRGSRGLAAMGRLGSGVNLREAQAELNTIADQLAREYPTNEGIGVALYPLWKTPVGATELGPLLFVLMGVAGVVLLVACANSANLLLVRSAERRREMTIRLSLGSTRTRLVRLLLLESTLLSLFGGAAGIGLAAWTSGLLVAFFPPTGLPLALGTELDGNVLAFALGISVLTALIFGLAPALQSSRIDLVTSLKEDSGTTTGARHKARLSNPLVVVQVSLSVVVLVAAGLLLRSLQVAQSFDPGFNSKGVLLASLDLFPNGYSPETGGVFYRQILDRTKALPGVLSVSLARRVHLGFGAASSTSLDVEGYVPSRQEAVWAYYNVVGPDYFRTMEIPLTQGRDFARNDGSASQKVGIINETMAKRYWPDVEPIGKRIRIFAEWTTVVGVAHDIKDQNLKEDPAPFLFLPVLQFYRPDTNLHVRTLGDPARLTSALRGEVQALDPSLPVFNVRTLESHVRAASFQQSLGAILLGVFGGLTLLLAVVGIYGILAYSVSQRRQEIGLRMALGAQPGKILKMVFRQGLSLTLTGLTTGLIVSLGVSRFLSSWLLGVGPADPTTFVGVAVLLCSVALLAAYLPARRATKVDPMVALRNE